MDERISYEEVPPKLFQGLYQSEAYLKSSGVDLKLLELIKYRVSQMNGCAFCLDMHHKEAIHMGESELRLHSLSAWRECPFYSEEEKAVLALAEILTNANQEEVDDTIYENLTHYYSKDAIATITLAIAQINTWNRVNKVFRKTPGNYVIGQFG